MGDVQYEFLPRHIAVQVSLYRWQIATLVGKQEWGEPVCMTTSDRMTESQCSNTLRLLQRKEREAKEKKEGPTGPH
jgi:hypothetical protein